jgi:hypothetical protein
MPSSSRQDRGPATLLRVGWVLVPGILALAAWPAWSSPVSTPGWVPPTDSLRAHGEFGLAVHADEDSVDVRWLTRTSGPGFLAVSVDGVVIHEISTEPWATHHFTFPQPAGERPELESFLLTYGGLDDPEDRHQTRIHLDVDARVPPVRIEGVDSLYVIADIHGEYDNLLAVLRNAGLLDEKLRWSGGRSHLAILGDMMSRGPDVAAVLWFLYRLEREAEAAGGAIHVTLGNHEIMVMLDDLRYVHHKEAWIADGHGLGYDRLYDPRRSVLGRWLASKPAVIRIDDALMTHGGVSGVYADHSLEALRDSLRTFMEEDLFYHWADTTRQFVMEEDAFHRRVDFFWAPESTFWYRGYAESDTLGGELEAVLEAFDARVHVVGHTPVPNVQEAYDGRFIMVNTIPFAAEVLRRTRAGDGFENARIPMAGPPEPLVSRPPITVAADSVGSDG